MMMNITHSVHHLLKSCLSSPLHSNIRRPLFYKLELAGSRWLTSDSTPNQGDQQWQDRMRNAPQNRKYNYTSRQYWLEAQSWMRTFQEEANKAHRPCWLHPIIRNHCSLDKFLMFDRDLKNIFIEFGFIQFEQDISEIREGFQWDSWYDCVNFFITFEVIAH